MKLLRHLILIVALGFYVVLSIGLQSHTSAVSSQLLVNGGFEQDSLDSWKVQGGGASFSRTVVQKSAGSYGVALVSNSFSEKRVYQIVSIVGGSPYTLSGYVLKNDAQVDSVLLLIAWYASADGTGASLLRSDETDPLDTDAQQFRLLTLVTTAPSEARSARVTGVLRPATADQVTVYFDDLSLEGVLDAISTGTAAVRSRVEPVQTT